MLALIPWSRICTNANAQVGRYHFGVTLQGGGGKGVEHHLYEVTTPLVSAPPWHTSLPLNHPCNPLPPAVLARQNRNDFVLRACLIMNPHPVEAPPPSEERELL